MDPLRRQFHALLADEDERDHDREINLSVRVERPDGSALYRAGGVWDRRLRRYVRWEHPHRIRLRKSQVELAEHGLWWLQERKAGRPRDWVVEFAIGDRGGGKTAWGSILAGLWVLEAPYFIDDPTIAWQVSKSHEERDELDRELRRFFPFDGRWYKYSEYRGHVYTWVTGGRLRNISADDEETLRRGRVDYIYVNEAGKMGKRVPILGMGRLKDFGGLGYYTSNRPTARGRWILNWREKEQEAAAVGESYPALFVLVSSDENEGLDKVTAHQVDTLINDIDPALADDMAHLFDSTETKAYPRFNTLTNLGEPPELGDITREFTRRKVGRPYDFIGSADFQGNNPGVVGTFWKIYGSMDAPILWAVYESEGGGEEEFLADLENIDGQPFTPATCMWTGDNTGQTQNGRHDPKDRTSFAIWTSHDWKIVPNVRPKDRDHNPANPRVERRMRLVNQLLAQAAPGNGERAVRHIMVSKQHCPRLAYALKECELKISGKFGLPYPAHPFSHLTDTAGYLAWWAWPKPKAPSRGDQGIGVMAIDLPRPRAF